MSKGISLKIKEAVFKIIMRFDDPFSYSDTEGYLPFLRSVWSLEEMPSEDDRFEDAEGDIIQHTLNNDDWDIEYLFLERLKLFKDDSIFIDFINSVVNPEFRKNEDEIINLIIPINDLLVACSLQLSLLDYSENELPIYRVEGVDLERPFPSDIKKNKIPFFVEFDPFGHNDKWHSHNLPSEFPAFTLVFNSTWNDYTFKTDFFLFYYESSEIRYKIGSVKIMAIGKEIDSILPVKFYILDDLYCSLGQEYEYYESLKDLLGKNFTSVLYALKDAAFFSEIQDNFEKDVIFRQSLTRDNKVERLLREAKHILSGKDLKNLYSFDYQFTPKYSNEKIDINFNFGESSELPNRVYALIGKNGTGKTQLITQLPLDISENKQVQFYNNIPMFSKVIAVSYSVFDNFKIPKKTAEFNYVYCGLRKEKDELKTEKSLLLTFHITWKKIRKQDRISQWRRILLTFIDSELISEFIVSKDRNKWDVSIEGYNKIKNKLSSGQSVLLYMISQIVANIRFDTLILFDEPETHLHPNAITELMNTIYSLVEEFESYCILATHSPLVIRECFSKNVYIIERHENIPSVRKISRESFGENLSVITEEVFGNKDTVKHYKTVIEEFVEEGKSSDDIINIIERDGVPLNLNARIYINSLISNRDA